jgi:mercuric ion transport protein
MTPFDKPALPACCASSYASAGSPPEPRSALRLSILPALGAALLPKCPLCAAAYLGVLGSLGPGRWLRAAWGLPLTAGCLAVAAFALGFRARRRRGYGPLALGLGAGALLLGAQLARDPAPALMVFGAAILVVATAWNTWPLRRPNPTKER